MRGETEEWEMKGLGFALTLLGDNKPEDWIKLDLHIHTLDDPKDKIDYSAHQLLERARMLGISRACHHLARCGL